MSRRANTKIPDHILNQLKIEICSKLGKDIKKTSDCKDLSNSVFIDTAQQINYNTLRRFFGIVDNKGVQINTTSLDILANYCGYTSFNFFMHKKPKLDVDELNETFLDLVREKQIDINQVILLCEKYGTYNQIYPFLEKCLVLAYSCYDISFFKQFYNLPIVFELKPFTHKSIFDLAMLYARLIDLFKTNIKADIINEISNTEKAHFFFFELYVDLDNINKGFSESMDLYFEKSKKLESKIFYHSLRMLQAFVNQEKNQMLVNEKALLNIKFEENKIHPILKGRLIANSIYKERVLLKKDSKIINQLISELSTDSLLTTQLFLIPVLQALQLTKNYKSIIEIIDKIPTNLFQIHDYLTDSATNHLKIYLAHYYVIKSEHTKALSIINQIEPKRFPKFEVKLQTIALNLMLKDFYLLEGNNIKSAECLTIAKNISNELGFAFLKE